MPEILVAEDAGVGADGLPRPTEDHVRVLDNAVLLLDGATAPSPEEPAGGWYAGLLADELADQVRAHPDGDLADLLADAIRAVADANGLRPGESPSSTVAMLRWSEHSVDALVLADSPIVACGQSGLEPVTDDRLAGLRTGGLLRGRGDARTLRNTEAGFWVAEADPAAAAHAVRRRWPRTALHTVLLATDGVSAGVDDYRLFDWAEVLRLATEEGPKAVLEQIRSAEREDPDGVRWPRPKRHDDQALVVVRFGLP